MGEKPILYQYYRSPFVRVVKIVAQLIDLELEIRDFDIFKGEHLQDENFLKINPEHTVPTLDDNGDVIWESHAIITYIVDKYASDDSLYPKDLYQRARVNQRLFFNSGTLAQRIFMIFRHAFGGGTELSQEIIDKINDAYKLLEAFLTDPYLVGDQLTVCDISVATTVSLLKTFVPPDDEQYPNTVAWLDRIYETVPSFGEINDERNQEIHGLLTARMDNNKENE